ncbi:MAG TPA: hypothetical protein VKU41_20335 [Polyangiaceae bacterium]|nr:hypothetical protein [Polyangiaceae bacterium]
MRSPKKIDFFRLPRPVQERFAAATRRTAPPVPLLFSPAPGKSVWAYLVFSGALAVAGLALLLAGWGQVASSMALHGPKLLAVDVVLFAASAYGVVHAMGILRAMDALPWRAGIYVFPACIVDAQSPALLVWSVADAASVETTASPASGLALRMGDGSQVVVPAGSDAAQRAEAALASIRQEIARAVAEEDPHSLAEFDPLHDRALSSPVGPTESMRPRVPVSKRYDWAIAIAIGAAVGLALGTTRNGMSDEAMYRAVLTSADVASYKQYLAQGGRHSDDVRQILLPRAELREAETQGTVAAIMDFVADHPATKIGPEIDAAVRRVMLAELEKAKKEGTVSALDVFAQKYPDNRVDAELKAARHALYVSALAAWKKKAQPDAGTEAFMGRLLAWAEKTPSASCEIRFRLKPSQTMDDADKSVTHSGHFPGPDALPSKYITADAMHPREQRIAQSLADEFSASFPADMLAARAGQPLAADAPAPATPTLVVDYVADWSRANTLSVKPPTVFAGLIFVFDETFGVPDGAPWKMSVKSWRGAEPWRLKGEALAREDFEQKIYDTMIDGAFDQLGKRVGDALF